MLSDFISHRRAGLLAAAERNWPWFAPAWVFPLLFLVYIAAEQALNLSALFEMLLMLIFFLAFFLAQVPRFLGQATFYETTVLGILVPFSIWVIGALASSLLLAVTGLS